MEREVAARGWDVAFGFDHRPVIEASDFTIPANRLTAVIGPNGSGKTTLLNGIAGQIRPQSGRIEVFGQDPARIHSRVAYVLQANRVSELLPVTVQEVVAMGRYAVLGFFGRFRDADHRAVAAALNRLDIDGLAGLQLRELSGGQRQRVFVAQGLVQEADLLILDEPLTGLDFRSREWIAAVISEELAAGRTVVTTTHDVADANNADHVILMAGRVVAEGSPAEALAPDRLAEAYELGVIHLEDGSVVLDDPHHGGMLRHVHFERKAPGRRHRQ